MENAFWHLASQIKGVPLHCLLGGTLQEIPCGVSLGIQPTIDKLLALVDREVSAGYQRIKLKIKPNKDVEVVREVRRRFPDIKLSVDANSAYSLSDVDHLKELDEFHLLMIEQPLEWDDIYGHSRLQAQLDTAEANAIRATSTANIVRTIFCCFLIRTSSWLGASILCCSTYTREN